jgi:hypothetical protein
VQHRRKAVAHVALKHTTIAASCWTEIFSRLPEPVQESLTRRLEVAFDVDSFRRRL